MELGHLCRAPVFAALDVHGLEMLSKTSPETTLRHSGHPERHQPGGQTNDAGPPRARQQVIPTNRWRLQALARLPILPRRPLPDATLELRQPDHDVLLGHPTQGASNASFNSHEHLPDGLITLPGLRPNHEAVPMDLRRESLAHRMIAVRELRMALNYRSATPALAMSSQNCG